MRLLRSFPISVIALVLLSIVGLCAAQKSVTLLVVAVTLAVISWYVTEGPRGRTLPRWCSNLLVIAVTIGVLLDLVAAAGDPLDVLGRFIIWLTLIKLYDRRTARDHAYLIALSLLLILVGCLKTQELLFGVVLVLYAGLGLYVLLLYQLYAAHETVWEEKRRSFKTLGYGRLPPGAAANPTVGRRAGFHFRVLAAGIGVVGIVTSVVFFVIFPRALGSDVVGARLRDAGRARAGFTDVIDLEVGTRITSSRRLVFDVQLIGGDGRPVRLDEPLLLRGAVLDFYADGRWSDLRGSGPVDPVDGAAPFGLGSVEVEPAEALTQRFRFRERTETVFSLYLPVAVRTTSPHEFEYAPMTQTLRSDDSWDLWKYEVGSVIVPTDAMAAAAAADVPPRLTRIELDDRADDRPNDRPNGRPNDRPDDRADDRTNTTVDDLARSLLAAADHPPAPASASTGGSERWEWNRKAAEIFAAHLRSREYDYSLDLSAVVRRSRDPISEFLLRTKKGHCEFFASGLAALCTAVDVNARVVTGYVAVEYDEEDERYLVRESNAHAWVEVQTGSFRFTQIDPTPPGVLEQATGDRSAFGDRMSRIYQRLESAWMSGIIQFDTRSQWRLFSSFDAAWSKRANSVRKSATEWASQVNRAFNVGPGGYIWLGIVAAVLVIGVIALVTIIRRYRLLRRTLHLRRMPAAESRRVTRQLGFYLDMLTVLHQGGAPKPMWQPPRAFASALVATRPAVAERVEAITDLYYESRYSGRRLTTEEIARARRQVQEVANLLEEDS